VLLESKSISVIECDTRKGVSSTKQGVSFGIWYIGKIQIIRRMVIGYFITIMTLIFFYRKEGVEL
jgi:hypothetical protein